MISNMQSMQKYTQGMQEYTPGMQEYMPGMQERENNAVLSGHRTTQGQLPHLFNYCWLLNESYVLQVYNVGRYGGCWGVGEGGQ